MLERAQIFSAHADLSYWRLFDVDGIEEHEYITGVSLSSSLIPPTGGFSRTVPSSSGRQDIAERARLVYETESHVEISITECSG